MSYTPTKWENSPSTNTPLNADNLNKLEEGVKEIHDMAASGQFDGKPGAKGAKGDKGDKGDAGPAGKDGSAVIDATSAGYGLSVKGGKIELGHDEQGIQLVEPPANDGALVFGRIDGNGLYGIIKSAGYISLAEGGASVGIIGETDPAVMDATGAKPLMDGKCRAHIMGYRTTIIAENEITLASGVTGGAINKGLSIPMDNKPRAFIDDYNSDASNAEYFIVNKKYLQSEIAALVARIEALEAK